MVAIPVLTLWQPWASLCVIINPATGKPYKTVETRGWSTKYRGRLPIHAAARRFGLASAGAELIRSMPLDAYRVVKAAIGGDPEMCDNYPLGAIVATCTLVDVVPMVDHAEPTTDQAAHLMVGTRYDADRLLLCRPSMGYSTNAYGVASHFEWATEIVTDQLPYGDFTPGRFAWLLSETRPVDPPVPFKGGQGLTKTWEPEGAGV